jgi:glycosyltransferase involved in cell wall biosynthesis
MKISLTCKLDSTGAYGFIKPIADIKSVSSIDVFRDSKAIDYDKVIYHTSFNKKNGFWSQFNKFLKMLSIINLSYRLSIGIYELPHGLLAFMIGRFYNIPTVISIIGNPAYTEIRKGIRKKITYFMYKRIFAVTVTGSRSKQFIAENGIPESKIFILPNSIDVKKFTADFTADKRFDLISLGRLSPEKELGNLLDIVFILTKTKPDLKVGIAGKGPELQVLNKQIIEKKLSSNVKLLGYVNDISEFYNSGKVFVLTSRTEGLPRTIIEAMSCGIPCVASNVGDVGDVVDDGVNGYLIQDYSKKNKYAEKINLLLTDKSEYDRMSENSIVKIRNDFSFKAATKVWKEIISEIGEK